MPAVVKLTLFLHICATGVPFSSIEAQFASKSIFLGKAEISQLFHVVLKAILPLYNIYVRQPSQHTPVAAVLAGDRAAFKDAVGAVDGTHFHAFVPALEQAPYRNREGFLSQNVLAAVNFDGNFTFVLAGWEGSAHDGRVFLKAMSLPNKKAFCRGMLRQNYYLADAGYSQGARTLVPFRGVRYHLREYNQGDLAPQTAKELWNYQHSSLRMVVERVFGMYKRRWQIWKATPVGYSLRTQVKLVYALCGLHNFINKSLGLTFDNIAKEDAEEELDNIGGIRQDCAAVEENAVEELSSNRAKVLAANRLRAQLALEMFREYTRRKGMAFDEEETKQSLLNEWAVSTAPL